MSSNPKVLLDIDARDKGSAKLDKFAGKIQTVGKIATSTQSKLEMAFANALMFKGLNSLIIGLDQSITAIGEFSKELTIFQALTKDSSSNVTAMGKSLRFLALGATQSSDQIAEATNQYIKMGKSQEEALAIMPRTLQLITAGGAGVTETLETVATAMNSFSISSEHAGWAMNQMLASSEASMQSFPDLAEGFKEVGPIAAEMGLTFHETLTLLGGIADLGLRGERGGTALKNMILDLLTPTGKVKEVLKDMKLEGKSFIDVIKEIGDNTTLKETLETMGLRSIGPLEGLSASIEKYHEMSETINANNTIVQDLAEKLKNSLGVELGQTGKLAQELGLNFMNAIGVMEGSTGLETINNQLRRLSENLLDNPESVRGIAKAFEALNKIITFSTRHFDELLIILAGAKMPALLKLLGDSFKVAGAQITMFKTAMTTLGREGVAGVEVLDATGKVIGTLPGKINKTRVALTLLSNSNVLILLATAVATLTNNLLSNRKELEKTEKAFSNFSQRGKSIQFSFYSDLTEELSQFDSKKADEAYKQASFQLRKLEDLKSARDSKPNFTKEWTELDKQITVEFERMQNFTTEYSEIMANYKSPQAKFLKDLKQTIVDISKINGFSSKELLEKLDLNQYKKSTLANYKIFEEVIGKIEKLKRRVAPEPDEALVETSNLGILGDSKPPKGKPKPKPKAPKKDPRDKSFDHFEETITKVGEGIDLSEGLLSKLKEVGDYDLYERLYFKSKASGDNIFEFSNSITEKLQEFYEEDEKGRNSFLRGRAESITKVSSQAGGTIEFISEYNDLLDKHIPEISKKFVIFGEEEQRFMDAQKRKPFEGAVGIFSQDVSRTNKGLEPTFKLGRHFEITSKKSKQLVKDLGALKDMMVSTGGLNKKQVEEITETYAQITQGEFEKRVQGNLQSISSIYESTTGLLGSVLDIQEARLKENHEAQMDRLNKEHDLSLKLAGDNFIRKGIIEQDYIRKQNRLLVEQEKEAKRISRNRKAIATTEALVNTFRSAVGVYADTPGGPILRGVAAGFATAFGLAQVASIQAQKYAFGSRGTIRDGRGSSDLIPAFLSEGEVVSNKDTVQALGGYEGFKQVLDDAIYNRGSRGSGEIHYHIGKVYGSEQYVRGLFKDITKESQAWQY